MITVFIAALLLLKSQTSITESSSLIAEDEAAIEAAERSSPLKGADFGRSRTGRRLRFFFMADIGLGPVNTKKKCIVYSKNHEEENSLLFYGILSFLRRSDRVCPFFYSHACAKTFKNPPY